MRAEPAPPVESSPPLAPARAQVSTPDLEPVTAPRAEDPEARWLAEVYKPGARQLTARAVVTGMILGSVMCLSNLYVVLKTGWSFGVTITSCVLAFAVWSAIARTGLVKQGLSVLENNAMGSVASAAGYMTGGGNMAALPALLLLTGSRPGALSLVLWFASIGALGVFAAIPIKRQLINIEQVPFPTGIATAETLQSMHGGEATGKARALSLSAVIGAVVAILRDVKALPVNLPAHLGLPFSYAGRAAGAWTLSLDTSLILVGGGAIMSFRTAWSLLLGALLTYGFLAPRLVAERVVTDSSYKGILQFTLWPGAAVLVSSGVLSFAFQWRSVVRSLSGLSRALRRGPRSEAPDPLAEVECPPVWFPAGFLAFSPVVVALMAILFGIPVWAGIIAIPLSLMMGVVAARVTGETDVTPTKALGPVTQFIYGALLPANLTANLMSANVTGGVGLHAADLLTDLKSGYLLGASPRQQVKAQLFGVIAGAAIVVPAFNLLVPRPEVLGTEALPAPSVLVWAGVSRVLAEGVSGLAPAARSAIAVGSLVGLGLALLERFAPPRLRRFVPSPSGLGIAMIMPGFNAISMFLGALLAEALRRARPALAERLVVPVSSGFIAGESLMGIFIAILVATGVLAR